MCPFEQLPSIYMFKMYVHVHVLPVFYENETAFYRVICYIHAPFKADLTVV